MGILRFLLVTLLVTCMSTLLVPNPVRTDIAIAARDVSSLVTTKAKELDEKYSLLKQSKTTISTVVKNPYSHEAQRVLGIGIASFVLGLQLSGPLLGTLLAFASTLVDFQEGLAGDAMDTLEEVAMLAWARMKKIGRRCFD